MSIGKVSSVSCDQEVRDAGDRYFVERKIGRVEQLFWYWGSRDIFSAVLEELENRCDVVWWKIELRTLQHISVLEKDSVINEDSYALIEYGVED